MTSNNNGKIKSSSNSNSTPPVKPSIIIISEGTQSNANGQKPPKRN